MTFEAVPPGQVPTRTTPMASSGGSAKSLMSASAANGMMMNCAITPMPTSQGCRSTLRKSSTRSVIPIPNMTTPSIGAIHEVEIQLKVEGRNKDNAATTTTIAAKYFDINEQTFKTLFFMLFLLSFYDSYSRINLL